MGASASYPAFTCEESCGQSMYLLYYLFSEREGVEMEE
jgi:hypothetical protein